MNALEEFRSLGIDFISLHEGVDTSTPNGRLVFGIFASIAEFDRELIRDRVRSGIAAARSKGKRLGRPKATVDASRVAALRRQGLSWAEITEQTGISEGTAQRAMKTLPKNLSAKTDVCWHHTDQTEQQPVVTPLCELSRANSASPTSAR